MTIMYVMLNWFFTLVLKYQIGKTILGVVFFFSIFDACYQFVIKIGINMTHTPSLM